MKTAITLAELRAAYNAVPAFAPTVPVVLPEWLYDAAKADGYDMRWYIRRQQMPTECRCNACQYMRLGRKAQRKTT